MLRRIGLLGIGVLTACGIRSSGVPRSQSPTEPPTAARSSASPIPIDGIPVCVLTPQATEGPFYFDANRIRQNIVEDRVGAPLRMGVRVMRMDDGCTPLKDALVDLWHVDASGAYSGYPGQPRGQDTSGRTFPRRGQAGEYLLRQP